MQNPIEMLNKRKGELSVRALAKQIPCSAAYLSDVLRGQRTPGPKILKFLGLERQEEVNITYRKRKLQT